MKKALDEANKNIPINTPIPDFLKENKEDKAATDALIEQFPHLSPLPEDNDDDDKDSPSSPYPIPLPPQQPEPDTDIIKTSLDSVFDSSSLPNKEEDIDMLLKEEEIPTNNIFTLDSFNQDHTTLFSHPPPSLEYFPQSPFPQQQQTLEPPPPPPPPPQPPSSPTNYIAKKKTSHGKNVNLMRELYENENNELKRKRNSEEEDEEEDEEEEEENKRKKEKSELRVTTKNNRRFHRTLFLKKKEVIVNSFSILSQKNSDLVVTAENKFREMKRIFMLKKHYIEKNNELRDVILDLELMEQRYRNDVERVNKKQKIK